MQKQSLVRSVVMIGAMLFGLGNALSAQAQMLRGAGSTFIAPLMSHWIDAYDQANPEVNIVYDPIASGKGIEQFRYDVIDFGATDAPLTNVELEALPNPGLQLPIIAGAVVAIYHLPNVGPGLHLTGDMLADIYSGRITQWNDPRIVRENPGTTLPALPIVVVHRSDGSGTTYLFSKYLSTVQPDWNTHIGAGMLISWPVGRGGTGNPGVASLVRRLPGAIGYVELAYAERYKLPTASVKNPGGNYVMASFNSMMSAIESTSKLAGSENRLSLMNQPGANSYPIVGMTYLLLRKRPQDAQRGRALVHFVQWALGPGQKMAGPLMYAPLPSWLIERDLKALNQLTLVQQ